MVSPVLVNSYLHGVPDLCFQKQWRSHEAKGDAMIGRNADDFVEEASTSGTRSAFWMLPRTGSDVSTWTCTPTRPGSSRLDNTHENAVRNADRVARRLTIHWPTLAIRHTRGRTNDLLLAGWGAAQAEGGGGCRSEHVRFCAGGGRATGAPPAIDPRQSTLVWYQPACVVTRRRADLRQVSVLEDSMASLRSWKMSPIWCIGTDDAVDCTL